MSSQRTVEIPESVLISAQSLDDLEDWLAANDPEFLTGLLQTSENMANNAPQTTFRRSFQPGGKAGWASRRDRPRNSAVVTAPVQHQQNA